MEAVPLKFVDSVVEQLGWETLTELAPNVRHWRWKHVIYLHYRNRVYYEVVFRKEEQGFKHAFKDKKGKLDLLINARMILKNRRFARIFYVRDATKGRCSPHWDNVQLLSESATQKLLGSIAPLIDRVSGKFKSFSGSAECTNVLLTSFSRKVYLRELTLRYCGQIAYDFLEDQINNSHFLSYVRIAGRNWPQSSLDLIRKFCLKGRLGRRTEATVASRDVVINSGYIKSLFNVWRTGGDLNFCLYYDWTIADDDDDDELGPLLNQGGVKSNPSWVPTTVVHRTKKSIACVSNSYYLIQCFICECRFLRCNLKERYPEYHNF
uniref:F-box domain-containing protein n=1 Tax=Steinernema glaseri TaxID=37863 RepID=A0A1I7ZCE1_9BILA